MGAVAILDRAPIVPGERAGCTCVLGGSPASRAPRYPLAGDRLNAVLSRLVLVSRVRSGLGGVNTARQHCRAVIFLDEVGPAVDAPAGT